MHSVEDNAIRKYLISDLRDTIQISCLPGDAGRNTHFRLDFNVNTAFEVTRHDALDRDIYRRILQRAEQNITRRVFETVVNALPEPTQTKLYGMDVIISPYYPRGALVMHPEVYAHTQAHSYASGVPLWGILPESVPDRRANIDRTNSRW